MEPTTDTVRVNDMEADTKLPTVSRQRSKDDRTDSVRDKAASRDQSDREHEASGDRLDPTRNRKASSERSFSKSRKDRSHSRQRSRKRSRDKDDDSRSRNRSRDRDDDSRSRNRSRDRDDDSRSRNRSRDNADRSSGRSRGSSRSRTRQRAHKKDRRGRSRSISRHRHKKHHRKRKERKRHRSKGSQGSSDSSKSYSRKRSKSLKKHKSKKKKKNKSSKQHPLLMKSQDQFGSRGIIHQGNYYDMREEFELWVREVKKSQVPDNKREAIELFKEFAEDYNTVTLPHEKYYNLKKFECEELEKERKKNLTLQPPVQSVFNDEMLRKQEQVLQKRKEQIKLAHQQLSSVDIEKAKAMREQDALRLKMKHCYETGDVETARKIQQRLKAEKDDF